MFKNSWLHTYTLEETINKSNYQSTEQWILYLSKLVINPLFTYPYIPVSLFIFMKYYWSQIKENSLIDFFVSHGNIFSIIG